VVDTYAAGEGSEDGGEPRAFVSINWVLTEEPLDLETELVRWGGGGRAGWRAGELAGTLHASMNVLQMLHV
jgi:hypothetical protein